MFDIKKHLHRESQGISWCLDLFFPRGRYRPTFRPTHYFYLLSFLFPDICAVFLTLIFCHSFSCLATFILIFSFPRVPSFPFIPVLFSVSIQEMIAVRPHDRWPSYHSCLLQIAGSGSQPNLLSLMSPLRFSVTERPWQVLTKETGTSVDPLTLSGLVDVLDSISAPKSYMMKLIFD